MKEQELIEEVKKHAIYHCGEKECYKEGCTQVVDLELVLEIVNQLDEPEKVKIPQMVADWIKKCKTFKSFAVSLSFALQPSVWEANGLSGECIEWLTDAENQETFARAWIFGYDVEKEKRYKVVMPNVSSSGGVLTRIKHDDSWIWIDTLGTIVEGRTRTRKELEEAGFGWVFSCEGVKVEEVEE